MQSVNLSRADLNLLVVFDAVARARSVTGAADALALSQPAVSHALNRLRELVGDKLFVRGRGGLILTPRAEAMVAPVRDILTGIGGLLAAPPFDPAATARRFRVAASDYAMLTVVPGLTRALRAAAPGAILEIEHVGLGSLERLETGGIDVALWGSTVPASPYKSAELFRERFVGLICARHPLAIAAGQGKLTLDGFLAFPHVMVTFRDPRQSPVDARLMELGRSRRIGVVSPNFAANIALLPGSDLIMPLPSRLAPTAQRDLVRFELPLDVPDYSYSAVWHRRLDGDPACTWLRRLIAAAVNPIAAIPRRTG
jgi:DNA-binding transcriptional LysR family regulator